MTTEEMKLAWKETSDCLDKCKMENNELREMILNGKRKTSLEQLASRYKRFSIIGIIMAIVSVFFYMQVFNEEVRIITKILMTVYFSTCFVMDYWLYRGVSSIDCQTMSVSEVSSMALYYKKKHLQFMMVLIPFAIVVLGFMFYSFIDDEFILYAAICGAILGLAIGLKEFFQFMNDYKTLA